MKVQEIRNKAGVRFVAGHFRPESAQLVEAYFEAMRGFETTDGILWITEGWRPARKARDLHTLGRAFDFRIHNLLAPSHEGRVELARQVVAAARARLGNPRCQFEIHGATLAQFHTHAEFDDPATEG